ncbi:hypothetical protein [Spongiactinospora sp. TRM90649]|uniref:nuclear transport factor 2 family protein n=1 Tax=Spongiactinospora sp. TRM90649 TaxID=3031114 RepID=UPI0023F6F35D|nr:hypothetical protein [Spongiactinospora sp. TRM90649]MDF5753746.1 hypothetical protein [Spongiactinospora sp. TRM90649]
MEINRIVGGALGAFVMASALAVATSPAAAATKSTANRESAARGPGCSDADRKVITRAFEAWAEGTGSITEVFAPGIVWRIEGRSLVSGTYNDKKELLDKVMGPFGARFDSSPEPFRPTRIEEIYCHGRTMVVHWHGGGVANDGYKYSNSYAWIMTLRRGEVVSGTAFFDTISFNELWRRVTPSRA